MEKPKSQKPKWTPGLPTRLGRYWIRNEGEFSEYPVMFQVVGTHRGLVYILLTWNTTAPTYSAEDMVSAFGPTHYYPMEPPPFRKARRA